MKFRKKPVIVDAIQWTGKNTTAVSNFCPSIVKIWDKRRVDFLLIKTLEGNFKVQKNDWIIVEPDSEHYYPCKPDIFEQTYEPVEDSE